MALDYRMNESCGRGSPDQDSSPTQLACPGWSPSSASLERSKVGDASRAQHGQACVASLERAALDRSPDKQEKE